MPPAQYRLLADADKLRHFGIRKDSAIDFLDETAGQEDWQPWDRLTRHDGDTIVLPHVRQELLPKVYIVRPSIGRHP